MKLLPYWGVLFKTPKVDNFCVFRLYLKSLKTLYLDKTALIKIFKFSLKTNSLKIPLKARSQGRIGGMVGRVS